MVHYLDNAATTAMRDVAVEAMMPLLQTSYGNPSGAHRMARQANRVVDESREVLASVTGFKPGELVFTSGGTEADNTVIKGACSAAEGSAICSAVEHHAILDPVLAVGGATIGVDSSGQVDVAELESLLKAINDDPDRSAPAVVSVMAANNETGVIQPLEKVAELVRTYSPDTILHCDAVQAICWLDLASITATFDSISLSAHKFGGPKGVGLVAMRSNKTIAPLLLGGSQERSRRGGTHNVAGIAAMAAAADATVAERDDAIPNVAKLRDRLSDGILDTVEGVTETGVTGRDRSHKIANISHFCFEQIESEALLFLLEKHDIMASAASSCASGAAEPSHVLTAMGYDRLLAFGSLRLSLGYSSTNEDVDAVLACLPAAVERLRERG